MVALSMSLARQERLQLAAESWNWLDLLVGNVSLVVFCRQRALGSCRVGQSCMRHSGFEREQNCSQGVEQVVVIGQTWRVEVEVD